MNQIAQYTNCFRSMDNFKRVCIAWLVMFFQQWSGVDASKLTCLRDIGDIWLTLTHQLFTMPPMSSSVSDLLVVPLLFWQPV